MKVIEQKCTVVNIDYLETIIDHYNIEKAKAHITSYKSEVDRICENIKLRRILMKDTSLCIKCETVNFAL